MNALWTSPGHSLRWKFFMEENAGKCDACCGKESTLHPESTANVHVEKPPPRDNCKGSLLCVTKFGTFGQIPERACTSILVIVVAQQQLSICNSQLHVLRTQQTHSLESHHRYLLLAASRLTATAID